MADKDLTNDAEQAAPGLAAEGRKHHDSRPDDARGGASFGPDDDRQKDDDKTQPNRGMGVGQTKISPLNDPND